MRTPFDFVEEALDLKFDPLAFAIAMQGPPYATMPYDMAFVDSEDGPENGGTPEGGMLACHAVMMRERRPVKADELASLVMARWRRRGDDLLNRAKSFAASYLAQLQLILLLDDSKLFEMIGWELDRSRRITHLYVTGNGKALPVHVHNGTKGAMERFAKKRAAVEQRVLELYPMLGYDPPRKAKDHVPPQRGGIRWFTGRHVELIAHELGIAVPDSYRGAPFPTWMWPNAKNGTRTFSDAEWEKMRGQPQDIAWLR